MKLLLDENLPIKLKHSFSGKYRVKTVNELGWSGKKNGDLLRAMSNSGFDGLITIDKNLTYQQNINRYAVTIFVLNVPDNKIGTLKPFIEEPEARLPTYTPDEHVVHISVNN